MTSTPNHTTEYDVVCDHVAATFPNAEPDWMGLIWLTWMDPAGIIIDEYIDGDTLMRVGVYPDLDNPDHNYIRDCGSAAETIALLTHLTEDQPEGTDWGAWATLRAAEWEWHPTPDRPCDDHFVGTETLRCANCQWDEAIHAYGRLR